MELYADFLLLNRDKIFLVWANEENQPTMIQDFCSVSDSLDSMFQHMKVAIFSCGKCLHTNPSLNTIVADFSGAARAQM